MKSSVRHFLIAACVWVGVATSLFAQVSQPSSPPARTRDRVAVLDLKRVFDENARFKQKLGAVKEEVEAFENQIKREQEALKQAAEGLALLKPGSIDFKTKERELAEWDSKLRVQMQLKRKEVLEKEAQLYLDTYEEIQTAVRTLADHYGISLVLRFDSASSDANNRQDIMRKINENVVYQKNLDLTSAVIQRLKPQTARGP